MVSGSFIYTLVQQKSAAAVNVRGWHMECLYCASTAWKRNQANQEKKTVPEVTASHETAQNAEARVKALRLQVYLILVFKKFPQFDFFFWVK